MAVLVGRTTAGTTADFNASGHAAVWKFVASASGDLKYLFGQHKVADATISAVTLGIYSDSGGEPAALLGSAAVDSLAAAQGSGAFRATLASTVAIVSGTSYWIGWVGTDSDGQFNFQGDAVADTYREQNSAAAFANPWVTGTDSNGGNTAILWGEDEAVAGPSAVLDFQRNVFPFILGDRYMQGVSRAGVGARRMGRRMGPSPMGGFDRFIFPRLHADYPTTQFVDLIAAIETSTAQALTAFKSKTIGVTTVTHAAQALTKFKSTVLGVATVTHAAQALTKFKSKTLGFASVAHVAQALSKTHIHFRTIGIALETSAAQAFTKFKSKLLGVVSTANAAQTLRVTKIKILIPATETDAAQVLGFTQGGGDILMTLTPATESDVAQALLRVKSITLGPASSLNAAQVLNHLKQVALGAASETDAAQVLLHLKRLSLSPAVNVNTAQALTKFKSKTLGVVSVSEIAQALVYTKTIFKTLNPALEFDLAVPLSIAGQEVTIVYRYRGPITIGRF